MKYHIEATDGDIGHVQNLLVDEETWAIRYMVVDTNNWWLGHEVLVAPQWIRGVRWADKMVSVALSQQAVKGAPLYDAAVPLSRAWEGDLYRHHGRAGYWAAEGESRESCGCLRMKPFFLDRVKDPALGESANALSGCLR